MCTVQVLLIADVTRRTDVTYNNNNNNALRPGEGALPSSICRRLFVDDNNPRPSSLLKTLEADLEKQVKERWNFDFRTGKPLPGRYQWVTVRPGGDAERVPQSDSIVSEVPEKTSDTNSRVDKRPRKLHLTDRRGQTMTQSKITDFLQQRKRHRTPGSDTTFPPKIKSRRQMDYSATSH